MGESYAGTVATMLKNELSQLGDQLITRYLHRQGVTEAQRTILKVNLRADIINAITNWENGLPALNGVTIDPNL